MRITAGNFRSRVIKSLPGDNTRPTTDKVREAVFSRIGPYFDSGAILDLFAGSGAIGLEAISRGMSSAVFVDNSRKAAGIIRDNIELLNCGNCCRILCRNWTAALEELASEGNEFDIIFCDPPYRLALGSQIAEKIISSGLLKPDGTLIIETSSTEDINCPEELVLTKQAQYGITKVSYFNTGGIVG